MVGLFIHLYPHTPLHLTPTDQFGLASYLGNPGIFISVGGLLKGFQYSPHFLQVVPYSRPATIRVLYCLLGGEFPRLTKKRKALKSYIQCVENL
jgi:hypothetical protein